MCGVGSTSRSAAPARSAEWTAGSLAATGRSPPERVQPAIKRGAGHRPPEHSSQPSRPHRERDDMAHKIMLSALRQRPALLLVMALLVPAVLAAEVEKTEAVAAVGEGPPTTEKATEETKADPEGQGQAKGKRQALYSGPFSSLLPAAYQLPAQASAGSAASLVSSGSSKAAAYQPLPLAGVGLPLGYGSTSTAFSPSFLRAAAYPGLLSAASSPQANRSSAGSPLAALLSAATPAAQYSAPHNYSLPAAANLLPQGSSYLPGGSFYASAAAPSAANFPQNFTFGQPAASSLFAQNSAAYPSFYPAPSGLKQNFNAGLFGAASTAAAFPGSVVAQGGIAPGSAGGPFSFYSYPVAGKSGQQSVATVGVSNQLLAPHRPLSLAEAKQRFPQYFSGVEEPYARFQQQLLQMQQPQQPQQQLQQPLRPQLQQPVVPVQHSRPAGPPKPPQVTEFPEEQRGSGLARPHPTPASSDADDEDDDGSYKERPAYKSGTYHSGAGVDHHKIRAEQEAEDEGGSDRHPNSYQRITYHNKPYHGEEESGKSSYPGYYPKAAYYKNHQAASSDDDEDSGRPQESSSEDDEDEEDHRPAYSSSYQRFPAAEVDSHFNRAAAESLSSSPGGPRPAAQTLHTYRFKLPDYATETYSPVTGRPSRTKGSPQRGSYQEHAEEEDAQDEDSEGRYSSPVVRIHKATWSYSRSQSSMR